MSDFENYDATSTETMPEAPGAAGITTEVQVTGVVGDLMNEVAKLGEVIPAGTYHFKANSYVKMLSDKQDAAPGFDLQPYFIIGWICQQEPNGGKRYADFVPWVSNMVLQEAVAGNPAARAVVRERLSRARAIMEACGVDISKTDFVKFLDEKPELKIPLNVSTNRKTGEPMNGNMKYLSLHRPG